MAKRVVDLTDERGVRWTDPQLAEQLARQERMQAQQAYLKGSRNPAIVTNRWLGLPVAVVGGTPVKALEAAATFPGRVSEVFGPGGTVSTGKESYLSDRAIGLGNEGAGFQFGGPAAPSGAVAAGRSRFMQGPVKAQAEMRAAAPKPKGVLEARVFPEYAETYPPIAEPVLMTDPKKGNQYLSKGTSPEIEEFQKARAGIQKEINAGRYTPYYDPAKRADVDPANYPTDVVTRDIKPKTAAKAAEHLEKVANPEALKRLNDAYEAGVKLPDAANWYFMKQLEDDFIKELGPEAGRKAFADKFAGSMASTTGGADPTSNFLMAMYGNYRKARGESAAVPSYEMPFPIGGRYASGNMAMFEKMANEPPGIGNPKRHDFKYSFLGHGDKPVMDEQMTDILTPGKTQPDWYGTSQEPVFKLAEEKGVTPRFMQEVGWAGSKRLKELARLKEGAEAKAYSGQPMIGTVNEAIERTSRLTGMPPDEVVRRGIIRSEIPIYSTGIPGAAVGAAQPYQGTWGDQPAPAQPTPPAAVPGAPVPPPGLLNDPAFWKKWQEGGAA